MSSAIIIYACDVGSTLQNNFGWARINEGENIICSHDIDELIRYIIKDYNNLPIAIGFECPLFIPIPNNANQLSKERNGDGNRSCYASAGLSVTTLGLHQLAYILNKIKQNNTNISFTLDWGKWLLDKPKNEILIWEAFVSGDAHSKCHIEDAVTAAWEFKERYNNNNLNSDVSLQNNTESLNLAAVAMLWSGFQLNNNDLHEEKLLVIKPDQRHKKKCNKIV